MIKIKDLFLNKEWVIESINEASNIIRPHLLEALEIHRVTGKEEVEIDLYLFTFDPE